MTHPVLHMLQQYVNCDFCTSSWWRHQMETFSALLAICAGNSPVPGEFPTQRPVTRSIDVNLDLRLNKPYSKQSWGWWSKTLSRLSWRHCNENDLCPFQNYQLLSLVYHTGSYIISSTKDSFVYIWHLKKVIFELVAQCTRPSCISKTLCKSTVAVVVIFSSTQKG